MIVMYSATTEMPLISELPLIKITALRMDIDRNRNLAITYFVTSTYINSRYCQTMMIMMQTGDLMQVNT